MKNRFFTGSRLSSRSAGEPFRSGLGEAFNLRAVGLKPVFRWARACHVRREGDFAAPWFAACPVECSTHPRQTFKRVERRKLANLLGEFRLNSSK
jgi:hypothetical protein